MRPRRQAYTRKTPPLPALPTPQDDGGFKTTGVTPADVIRIRSKVGSGIFRDGMTVGDFLRAVQSRQEGIQRLGRCQKAGIIGFEQATLERELDEAAKPDALP
ncbi:hypothetical protein NKI09_07090 [Mesorhizobium sp. M0757]|uniref:hypothetical protein n=1 Tax=Mesorhizobium sp. M0757 TaxID=2956993 RepID=UPI0033375E5F